MRTPACVCACVPQCASGCLCNQATVRRRGAPLGCGNLRPKALCTIQLCCCTAWLSVPCQPLWSKSSKTKKVPNPQKQRCCLSGRACFQVHASLSSSSLAQVAVKHIILSTRHCPVSHQVLVIQNRLVEAVDHQSVQDYSIKSNKEPRQPLSSKSSTTKKSIINFIYNRL